MLGVEDLVITILTIRRRFMSQVTTRFRGHTIYSSDDIYGMTDCDLGLKFKVKKRLLARGRRALRYRGGPHLRYVFRGRRGLFLKPPHVRDFVKEGYFFLPRYEVWGSKSPYNPRNIRDSDAE